MIESFITFHGLVVADHRVFRHDEADSEPRSNELTTTSICKHVVQPIPRLV